MLSGTSPFADHPFDPDLRLFVPTEAEELPIARGRDTETFPTPRPFGNMVVGQVSETGVDAMRFLPGDRAYAYGPIAEQVIQDVSWATPLTQGMPPHQAVCVDPAINALAAVQTPVPGPATASRSLAWEPSCSSPFSSSLWLDVSRSSRSIPWRSGGRYPWC